MAAKYLPLIAAILPLLGAGALALWPAGSGRPSARRWACLGVMLATLALLLVAGASTTSILTLPLWGQALGNAVALLVALDHPAMLFALLATVGAVAAWVVRAGADDAQEPVAVLYVLGAIIAASVSASLLALCFAWVLLDVGLLWLDIRHASALRSRSTRASRGMSVRTVSTAALIAATTLLAGGQGGQVLSLLSVRGVPLALLVAAAVLRLAPYPLPGSQRPSWLAALAATVTGASLWVRITNLAGMSLPGATWLLPTVAGMLLLTALLGIARPPEAPLLPRLRSHSIGLLILAPLIAPHTSATAIVALVVSTVLAGAVLPPEAAPPAQASRWQRLAMLAALGTLAGLPLTPGFLARWWVLGLAWQQGRVGLLLVLFAALTLASFPAWRRLHDLAAGLLRAGSAEPSQESLPAAVASGVCALVLAVSGLAPAWLGAAWPGLVGHVHLPTWAGWGERPGAGAALVAAALPLLVSLAAYRRPLAVSPALLGGRADGERPASSAHPLGTILEMDWLYLGVERLLGWLHGVVNQTLEVMEGSVALGWIVFWALVLALYLTGG